MIVCVSHGCAVPSASGQSSAFAGGPQNIRKAGRRRPPTHADKLPIRPPHQCWRSRIPRRGCIRPERDGDYSSGDQILDPVGAVGPRNAAVRLAWTCAAKCAGLSAASRDRAQRTVLPRVHQIERNEKRAGRKLRPTPADGVAGGMDDTTTSALQHRMQHRQPAGCRVCPPAPS